MYCATGECMQVACQLIATSHNLQCMTAWLLADEILSEIQVDFAPHNKQKNFTGPEDL